MHVFGVEDPIVPAEHSKELAAYFPEPFLYEHEGKHFLPVTSPAKQQYTQFVNKFS